VLCAGAPGRHLPLQSVQVALQEKALHQFDPTKVDFGRHSSPKSPEATWPSAPEQAAAARRVRDARARVAWKVNLGGEVHEVAGEMLHICRNEHCLARPWPHRWMGSAVRRRRLKSIEDHCRSVPTMARR
jgi:hypothetical protein